MTAYDTQWFDPPAPMARVTIRHPVTGITCSDVPLLLDYGADVTLLPRDAVGLLGIEVVPDQFSELVGYDGQHSLAPIVQADVILLGQTFRGYFPLADEEWGIMGRNMLNCFKLLLDGPNLSWAEQPT